MMDTKRTGFSKRPVRFIFPLLLLLPLSVSALTPQQDLRRLALRQAALKVRLWEDPYWLKLLYYEDGLLGGRRSPCTNPRFFLHKWGHINPRLELEAAIDGFFYEGEADDSPACAFPERYRWLREALRVGGEFPPPRCAKFEDWKAVLDPEKVTLLFAAGYLNNPSTLYGHTFLRLHKRGGEGADLLDYTINYAATTDAKGGFLYAVKGLIGAYPGQFSTIPYYLKIQEYRNIENRDLWEFPLNLSGEEIDRLLRHCWELGKASFPYLFFTRNCSWQLMPLLDIVKPELDLARRFNFWVIPSDTARAAIAASSPAEPGWRPSLWKTVEWKRSRLSPSQRASVLELARGDQRAELDRLAPVHPALKAPVLELAADYLSWRYHARKIDQKELDGRTDPILAARAALGTQDTFPGAPARPPSIMASHESMRLGAGLVSHGKGPAYELQARFALQDLLDDPEGYLPDAALEMGSLKLRYDRNYGRGFVQQGRLVQVMSLNPWDDWVRRQSWSVSAGLEQAPETGRGPGRATVWAMNAGAGLAAEWDGPVRQVWYAMFEADTAFGGALRENWRLGGGLKAGVLGSRGPWRGLLEARYIGYAFGDSRPLWAGAAAVSFKLSRNASLRSEFAWRGGDYRELGLYLHHFVFPP
ncbi:MAG: DUF4105 domain-containing protein [Elusimicrobiales bacterium]|nr:DUF4105 domain-containing protein [Elusimicrobiales bacterium]